MKKIKVTLIVCGCILSMGANVSTLASSQRTLAGKAYDAKTQAYLYDEDHVFNDDPANASMTSYYRDAKGEMIAEKVVRFNKKDRVTGFEFKQSKMGVARKLIREPDLINYSSTENNKTSSKELKLKPDNDVVIDAGLFSVVGRNWQTLMEGEKVRFDLAMPAKKRTINMELSLINIADSAAVNVMESDDLVLFSMNVTSRLQNSLHFIEVHQTCTTKTASQ